MNKPGAATNIAAQAAINSPADGYTLLWIGTSNAINATLYKTLPFDFFKSIAPVAGICVSPMVIVANPSVPANNIADLIALAKTAPGKMTMASFGTGTISHVAGELFKTMAGANMVHVPYRGGAPMINDLIGGHVQVGVDVVANALPHIRSGAVRALAVTTSRRLDVLPNVSTVAETVPGYEALVFTGVGVRAGTPDNVVVQLNRVINAGLSDLNMPWRAGRRWLSPCSSPPMRFPSGAAPISRRRQNMGGQILPRPDRDIAHLAARAEQGHAECRRHFGRPATAAITKT